MSAKTVRMTPRLNEGTAAGLDLIARMLNTTVSEVARKIIEDGLPRLEAWASSLDLGHSQTSFVIKVVKVFPWEPKDSLTGRYLEGPRSPAKVKQDGYGFTDDPAKAWPFPTRKQAQRKAAIVDRHMGWGAGVLGIDELRALRASA
jgi:hypothetical protein